MSDRDRPRHAAIDPNRVQAAFVEQELGGDGQLVDVATLLTTGRECIFDCVFCDLWRHTLPGPTPHGAIVRQLDAVLPTLPPAKWIKLYNASNWFDATAVPPADWPAIADRLRPFERVIVENHPKLCTEAVPRFRDLLDGQLEVAIGLESIDPRVLPRLNKSMTADDAARALERLRGWGIDVRAFVLVPPPFVEAPVPSTIDTVRWAFERGVEVVSLLPLRPDQMNASTATLTAEERSTIRRPSIEEVAAVLANCRISLPRRLFVDAWDASDWCDAAAVAKLANWNLTQRPPRDFAVQ